MYQTLYFTLEVIIMTLKAKILCFAVILSMLLVSLCSCGANPGQIVEVWVDGSKVYQTIYLYSFKDAEIGSYYDDKIEKAPTTTGYIYSKREFKKGDRIEVSVSLSLKSESDSSPEIVSFYSNAVVDKVVRTYKVKVTEKKDTYLIEYYEEGIGATCASEQKDLAPVECFKIEVTKERVTIKYKG